MRMLLHRLRTIFDKPFWFVLIGSLILGVILGTLIARETSDDVIEAVLGSAWRKNASDTRNFLMTMLSLQLTVLALVVSLNASMIQSAANQYSPRLVPFYLQNVPFRRALPMFVLSTGFIIAAVREVGFGNQEAVRPRPVLSAAIALVLLAFVLLAVTMVRTYRFMRVELILSLVRDSTFAAIKRRVALLRSQPLAPHAQLTLAPDATALPAQSTGYLSEVYLRGITRLARRAGVRVRISRNIGDHLDAGEVIGWARPDDGGMVNPRLARRLAACVLITPARAVSLDPAYGIRILSEVAARAVSSSYNDSYTARQALHQIRSVLRRLARLPLGDWSIVDPDGRVRVSVMATELREFLSVAVEAPLRYGAGDPDVLDGILEIALEVGLVAPDAGTQAAAYHLIDRVLEDATEYGNLRNGRLKRLLAEADLVRASLQDDGPRPDRHERADWALTASDSAH
jgi:uncharacterized membrane protein